ncbi:hypothetical protein TWF102_002299 [Orbilia oligospora]|uniref:AAA+ ATPase domain-containing protein n=1 Tax=Orbilia oligospora TaxID=2813651 RepID=A0A7C8NFA2_ORBOL|nr:hypothetical protein TWF103_008723 [Orbilia oligospora]KAF3105376.1 hypothetical protein TWF102_002299 [Orbilia oligospora]
MPINITIDGTDSESPVSSSSGSPVQPASGSPYQYTDELEIVNPEEIFVSAPAEAVPSTISEDTTNKDTFILGILSALASRQEQIITSTDPQQSQNPYISRLPPPPPDIFGDPGIPPSNFSNPEQRLYRDPYTYTPSDGYQAAGPSKEASSLLRFKTRTRNIKLAKETPTFQTEPQMMKHTGEDLGSSHNEPPHTMTTLDSAPMDPTRKQKTSTEGIQGRVWANIDDTDAGEVQFHLPGPPMPENGSASISIGLKPNPRNLPFEMMSSVHSLSPSAPLSSDITDKNILVSLRQRVRELESQIAELRKPTRPEKQTLHRIFCSERRPTTWLDKPRVGNARRQTQHYEADIPIPDEKAYFKRNEHIQFVVYQDFKCCSPSISKIEGSVSSVSLEDDADSGIAMSPFSIISEDFNALICSLQARANIRGWNHGFKLYEHIVGPHNCILRHIGHIRATILTFKPRQQYLLNLLFDFIDETFGDEFRRAIQLFSQGYVSKDTLCYLMSPDDVIVRKDKMHRLQAYVVETWPSLNSHNHLRFWVWSWKFNGLLRRIDTDVVIDLEYVFKDIDMIQINQLAYYPLEYADPGSKRFLELRGLQFWRCRHRRFVSYSGWDADDNEQFVNVRFMIDTMTYRKMHPQSSLAKEPLVDDLGERMEDDSPLEGDQILVLPSTIYGFHVQEKKWFNLKVDFIQDISWNKMAFKSLVIDEGTKDLVVALVSNKIAAEAGTDLMSNKGNGLIILLHGAPGTGKTLTAGNVAEHAEKPLYRVTTGDVGTDPEAVEKYLTSVLYLGKIWGCIVLLDEADVFLEERTLSDLPRNALVSVFLRVLEYYDGILILTSNRVGTFDSAFKSRIQLALHYDSLTHQQRIKIWQGFIKRLEDVAYDDIDIDELSLDKNIKKLAKHNLNGRQIRNNITTARQLALYKKEQMNMSHLESVIEVSQKFENYLQKVKSGTDEDLARDEGLR